METYIAIIKKINTWVGKAVGFLLIPMTAVTAYEVVMRYIFVRPTIWAWDLNIQIFAVFTLLAGGYTLLEDAHVSVDVFVLGMEAKRRALLDLITSFFFFLGIIVLVVGGWQIGWTSLTRREAMPTFWAPPYYIMKMMIPVGGFLVLIQGIASFLKNLLILFDRKKGE